MEKQYKRLEKEKKVSELLKKHDNLTSEEVVFLIDFFITLKNKELRTNIPYEIIETEEPYAAAYDEIKGIIYINKQNMIDKVINKKQTMSIKNFGVITNLALINHEFRHVTQFSEFKCEPLLEVAISNPKNVLFAKEHLTNEMIKILGMVDNYKLNYKNMLFEHDADYYGIKNTATWLSFFSPELKQQYLRDNQEEYDYNKQVLEDFTNLKQVTGDNLQRTICKTTLFTDAAIMQNPKLLKEYPILKSIYHHDGSKKTYMELMNDRTNFIDKVNSGENNESKIAKINRLNDFYDTIIKIDPILTIEKKLDDIEQGVLVGRDSKSLDQEVNLIIDSVKDMDVQFFIYIKEIIDSKIKNYQNKKQMLNKGFNEKLKSLPEEDREQIITLRKNWLKKSETITRQQEVLVNIFTLLNQHNAIIKEKENKELARLEEMTIKEADKILKEKFHFSKANKYKTLTDGHTEYKVPNYELKKMLLLGVDNMKKILNTNSSSIEKEIERVELNKIRQAILVVFSYDGKKDTKENSIKTAISLLNTIYEKLETEKLENFDKLFNSLSITSKYLLALEDRLEINLNNEIITPSIFSELIISGESYVKEIKRPEELEMEKVSLIHKTKDIALRETIEKVYNKYIDEASVYYEYDMKRNK